MNPRVFLTCFAIALISPANGLLDEKGNTLAIYSPPQTLEEYFDRPASASYLGPTIGGTSFGPSVNINPFTMFLKFIYYGQYIAPGLLPIVFSITNFGRSLHCWVSMGFTVFFISEWLRTGIYPFLPFALNFSDYYPGLFPCIFLMTFEHLFVGCIAYHFSTIAWSPDGPAWRQAYGFRQKATFSTLEIFLGWDPSPYYSHVFVFSYALFKYFGFIALEYKARRNAAGGTFPILYSLIRFRFVGLIISRLVSIVSGLVLIVLFLHFLYDLMSGNEILVFFAIFYHQTSYSSFVLILSISGTLMLVGTIAHFL